MCLLPVHLLLIPRKLEKIQVKHNSSSFLHRKYLPQDVDATVEILQEASRDKNSGVTQKDILTVQNARQALK